MENRCKCKEKASLIVDDMLDNANIAMHFQDKLYTLFSSVQSLNVNLSLIKDTTIFREKCTGIDVEKVVHQIKKKKLTRVVCFSLKIVFMVLISYTLCYIYIYTV